VGKGRGRRSHDFSRRNPHHTHIIDKYGPENIDVARMDCSSEALAFDLERGIIKCLRKMGVDLVNATDGGEGVSGLRHSEQSRAQMSSNRVGKRHREETKTKMSEVRRGQANHFFGESHSDETKKRISEAKKANPTNYWSGKFRSEETRAKLSLAIKEVWRKRKQTMIGENL
jgi:hypothetical protein